MQAQGGTLEVVGLMCHAPACYDVRALLHLAVSHMWFQSHEQCRVQAAEGRASTAQPSGLGQFGAGRGGYKGEGPLSRHTAPNPFEGYTGTPFPSSIDPGTIQSLHPYCCLCLSAMQCIASCFNMASHCKHVRAWQSMNKASCMYTTSWFATHENMQCKPTTGI